MRERERGGGGERKDEGGVRVRWREIGRGDGERE